MKNKMDKELKIILMEKLCIWEIGRMVKDVTGQNTTKTDWRPKLIQKVVRLIYGRDLDQVVPLVFHSQAPFTKLKYYC